MFRPFLSLLSVMLFLSTIRCVRCLSNEIWVSLIVGLWFLRDKTTKTSTILLVSKLPTTKQLTTIDISLDHLAEVVLITFLHSNRGLPISLCAFPEGLTMFTAHFRNGQLCSIFWNIYVSYMWLFFTKFLFILIYLFIYFDQY